MARPYGEGIVFNILMKVIYIAYLAMYMAYAVLNYIAETGNDLVNFIVISFISVSIVIFIIANVMDWVYKNADARSKIKVRLHTLRNVFKIIKVGVTILVLAQTITDDSWNALTITMLVISLPTSLLWLLGEYIYVAVKGIFSRGGRGQSEDTDEEYDDVKRVTPVHDTIERVKQFAESELIVMRPHEVDYDSDEEEDVEDRYLGYEEDDDYSYPPSPRAAVQPSQGEYIPERRAYPEYEGIFTVEAMPMTEDAHDFSVEEYDMNAVLGSEGKEQCGGENADVPPADGGKQRAEDGDTPAEEGGGFAPMAEPAPQNGQIKVDEETTVQTVPEDIFEDMIPGQAAEDISGEAVPEQVAQDKPEESAPNRSRKVIRKSLRPNRPRRISRKSLRPNSSRKISRKSLRPNSSRRISRKSLRPYRSRRIIRKSLRPNRRRKSFLLNGRYSRPPEIKGKSSGFGREKSRPAINAGRLFCFSVTVFRFILPTVRRSFRRKQIRFYRILL